jgi:putative transposase
MPRNARIDIPGLLQHVIVRGIEKRPIFLDDQDREEFLARLSLLLKETSTDCFAWALLNSHFHLLVQPQFGEFRGHLTH